MTDLLGIDVPSSDPVFLAIVFGVHIPLGIACVIAGAIAMLRKRGHGGHSTAGKVYFWCLAALFGSATALSLMRWAEDYPLFIFGAAAFACALFGRTAILLRWPYWTRLIGRDVIVEPKLVEQLRRLDLHPHHRRVPLQPTCRTESRRWRPINRRLNQHNRPKADARVPG